MKYATKNDRSNDHAVRAMLARFPEVLRAESPDKQIVFKAYFGIGCKPQSTSKINALVKTKGKMSPKRVVNEILAKFAYEYAKEQ